MLVCLFRSLHVLVGLAMVTIKPLLGASEIVASLVGLFTCHSQSRIWRAFGLKPHRTEAFKLSPDPLFIDKVRDIVAFYVNPPDAAVVLCVDEKSQIQALD